MSLITHRGPWCSSSRRISALRFIESYLTTIDTLALRTTPSSAFFSPNAVFHDTKGDVYLSGPHIWSWTQRLFKHYDSISHEVVEVRVIPESDGRSVVYGEFVRHFRLRGDKKEIVSPMFGVFTVGPVEGEGGTDGLQMHEASVFWDTGMVARHVQKLPAYWGEV